MGNKGKVRIPVSRVSTDGERIYEALNDFCASWKLALEGPARDVLNDFDLTPLTMRWCRDVALACIFHRTAFFGLAYETDVTDAAVEKNYYLSHSLEELAATVNLMRYLLDIPQAELKLHTYMGWTHEDYWK